MVMHLPEALAPHRFMTGGDAAAEWDRRFAPAALPLHRAATPLELLEDSCRHADFEFAAGVRHRHARRQQRDLEVACMDAIENKRPLPPGVLVHGRSGDLYRVTHTMDADR